MKKKIISIILAIAIVSTIITGCSSKPTTKTLSEAEKIEVLNEIKTYELGEEKTLEYLENLIDKNISNYDNDEKDIMISQYINQLYSSVGELTQTLYVIGYELEDVVEKYEVNVSDKNTFKKIPDNHATVRGFLQEASAKGFKLEKSSQSETFQVVLDSKQLFDKYGSQSSVSLAKFLEFNAYEDSSENIANSEERTINIDEVVKRLLMAEEGIKLDKEIGYKHLSKWMNITDYYYPILLGINHDYFVSSDYLKVDILDKYKEIAEANKGNRVGDIVSKVVTIYEKYDRKDDSVTQKQISDIMQHELYTEDEMNQLYYETGLGEIEEEAETQTEGQTQVEAEAEAGVETSTN